MKIFKNKILYLFVGLTFLFSCAELDTVNPNNADVERALGNPSDVKNLVGGAFSTWYHATHEYSGVGLMMNTMSDNQTCSWGNQAMRDMSWEPRKAWDNAPNYSYAGTTRYTFYQLYSALGSANTALKLVEDGMSFGEDDFLVYSMAKFVQGISIGYLGLIFDQAYIVNEFTTDAEIGNPVLVPYADMVAEAIVSLDQAIAMANGSSFVVPGGWVGGEDLSSAQFSEVINTFAARILSYAPRNATENAAVNWAKVKSYAQNGVSFDFAIEGDGYNNWYNEHMIYSVYPGWGRTDMRIINMMDADQPEHWTDDAAFPHPPATAPAKPGVDARLYSDFGYHSSNWFRTERGYYHFSNYSHDRYDYYIGPWTGTLPEIYKVENDMLLAEAEAHTGGVAAAATIINAGTRVSRGNLAPVASNMDAVMAGIHRERQIELMNTGLGIQFFEMRKNDLLQKGTPLHLPLPAAILEILNAPRPFYTFGGVDNADGINASNGGWR